MISRGEGPGYRLRIVADAVSVAAERHQRMDETRTFREAEEPALGARGGHATRCRCGTSPDAKRILCIDWLTPARRRLVLALIALGDHAAAS